MEWCRFIPEIAQDPGDLTDRVCGRQMRGF
jgi:hypothetical protein